MRKLLSRPYEDEQSASLRVNPFRKLEAGFIVNKNATFIHPETYMW